MELLIKILGSACLGILISQFTPLQRLIDKLQYEYPKTLFSCSLCLSFWISLVSTQNIFLAGITSIIAILINKVI